MGLNRRRFLQSAAVLGVSAMAPWPLFAQRGGGLRPLRKRVGVFTARGGTIGWFVSEEGIVVIDSQFPDTAQECLDGLRERAKAPISALINTHHHGDHTAGNGVFRKHVHRIVAHENVPGFQRAWAARREALEKQTYPTPPSSGSGDFELAVSRFERNTMGRPTPVGTS